LKTSNGICRLIPKTIVYYLQKKQSFLIENVNLQEIILVVKWKVGRRSSDRFLGGYY